MSKEFYKAAQDLAKAAVRQLPERWNDDAVNRRGIRAEFRRWRPDATGVPTMEMRGAIWADNYLFAIISKIQLDGDEEKRQRDTNRMIDQAAILVSLRAVAGEHSDANSFGKALLLAGVSDTRFARLATTPKSGRLEAVRRAIQVIERKGEGIDWTKETSRFHRFLFGSPDQAKNAVDAWAADFFRARGKAAEGQADTENTTDDTNNE